MKVEFPQDPLLDLPVNTGSQVRLCNDSLMLIRQASFDEYVLLLRRGGICACSIGHDGLFVDLVKHGDGLSSWVRQSSCVEGEITFEVLSSNLYQYVETTSAWNQCFGTRYRHLESAAAVLFRTFCIRI